MPAIARTFATLLVVATLSACAVNPVTGERELTLVGEASEIRMGEENYLPMRQSQGGEYDIDPELTAYVQRVGQRLAEVSDRPLPYEFVVLNNSVPNAWALPGGKIAINRGLLTELGSEAELAAVLGHEIVHAAARHSARKMEQGMLLQGLVLATAVATSDSDYGNLAIGGANLGAQLLGQKYSRGAELEADRYGMEYMKRAGYDPQGAVDLQETFVRLSEGRQSDWLSGLFASHPPSTARVEANRQTAAELGAGGETGRDRYRDVMAQTKNAIPAYEAYDEGRKALAENNVELALRKAEQAIERLPAEAHFYALRGDARLVEKDHAKAITNYDTAIRRRDNFFYYYLQRGRAHEAAGSDDAAERDLEQSLALLPTAPAHLLLGDIAKRRGNREAAIGHYRIVAKSEGEAGERARRDLARLELEQQPGSYVQVRCDVVANRGLVISVRNGAPLAVRDVVVQLDYAEAGQQRRLQRQFGNVLQPGEVASTDTGLAGGQPGQVSQCPVQVIGARVAE